jgi:hypothetical protein
MYQQIVKTLHNYDKNQLVTYQQIKDELSWMLKRNATESEIDVILKFCFKKIQ